MAGGVVKWFDSKKGFGFIRCDVSQCDVFVHFSQIDGQGFRKLSHGDHVEFDVNRTDKGPHAEHVRIVSSSVEQPVQ